jgi:hypothetical protein
MNVIQSINCTGMTYHTDKPDYPEVGDVWYDSFLDELSVFNGQEWLIIDSAQMSKQDRREDTIDDLLDNDEFDPYYFGFESNENPTNRYYFNYDQDTYEIIRDRVHSNFYIVRLFNQKFDNLVYYRGKIPTNKFALELFKNMNFGFLPIVHREIKISDILD